MNHITFGGLTSTSLNKIVFAKNRFTPFPSISNLNILSLEEIEEAFSKLSKDIQLDMLIYLRKQKELTSHVAKFLELYQNKKEYKIRLLFHEKLDQ